MGTGDYALGLNFKGTTPPTGGIAHRGGAERQSPSTPAAARPTTRAASSTASAAPSSSGITPDNGVSSRDGITNSPNISLFGSAPSNDIITVYCNNDAIGTDDRPAHRHLDLQ